MLQFAYNNPTRTAIVSVITVTLFGIALQAWRFADILAAPQPAATPTPQTAVSAAVVARITAASLFGRSGNGSDSGSPPPESTLGWVLRGVFTGPTPQTGSAIVETDPGKSHLVRAGGDLPAGGTLAAVYDDRVVIERNGQRETLRFPVPAAGPGDGGAGQAIESAAQSGVTITPARREEIRKRLEQLRQRARRSQQ